MDLSAADMITIDMISDVAFLTLNRPPLNILNLVLIRELAEKLEALAGPGRPRGPIPGAGQPRGPTPGAGQPQGPIHHSTPPLAPTFWAPAPVKALVLAANGKAFCAGVDVADHLPDRVEPMIREFGALFTQLRTFPVPTIAVVQGAALGGGTELAVACDLVLAGTSARFGQPEIKLGVFPPVAAALFPRLIGYQQAARLLFSGETIAATEAARLGLITFAVADEEVMPRLEQLLNQFRGLSAAALHLTKRALLYGAEQGVEGALPAIEDLYLRELMATTDAGEGIRAFMEKRPPAWIDR